MAGEWLLQKLTERGGADSELADIIYGTVSSESPLRIKIGGGLELPSSLISRGRVGTKYNLKIDGKSVEVDDKLKHYADMRISLDLDDGVKVNYGKFGDLLADVKAITGSAPEVN